MCSLVVLKIHDHNASWSWLVALWGLLLSLSACGSAEDSQEHLSQLHVIGASTLPLVSLASRPGEAPQVLELTAYVALPPAIEVTSIEPLVDGSAVDFVSLSAQQIKVKKDSYSYQSYVGFQLLSFKVDLAVPENSALSFSAGSAQVRYGLSIKTAAEEEKFWGVFLVSPPGSPELGLVNPGVAISSPNSNKVVAANSEVEINAVFKEPPEEELQLAWFVSGGEIKNRRVASTSWKTKGPGRENLIFTARDRKHQSFSMDIVTVTVE